MYIRGMKSMKVRLRAIRKILPTVSDRPAISFTRILEFSSHTRACNVGTRDRVRASACRAVTSACAHKSVCFAINTHKRAVRTHTRIYVYVHARLIQHG